MGDLLLKYVRPMGGAPVDILVEGGKIKAIGEHLSVSRPDMITEEGHGRIVIPGFVDAHTHLDKTNWGQPWHVNDKQASLRERIDFERDHRISLGIDPYRQSMRHALGLVAHGTTHIRSHVDIDTTHGVSLLEGLLKTRDELKALIDIELVAFPQSGIMNRPGTKALLDQALTMGCEVLGGIDPCGMDRDPKGHLDTIFALADKHGKPLDIHIHELGELGAFSFEMIFERTKALGMQGNVAISHGFALGSCDPHRTEYLIQQMAQLDVALLTTGSPSAPVPAILKLKEAGIRVGGGCDGIRDTWGPWGQPDMLDRAKIIGMKNGFRRDVDLEYALYVCSQGGADVMRLTDYGLTVGKQADMSLLTGETLAHAVVDTHPRPLVIKRGIVSARSGVPIKEAP